MSSSKGPRTKLGYDSGGEKGINVDVGGGEERDVGGGEEKDVGGDEEKFGNPNDEDDNDEDEWFIDFSCMRKEVEVEVEFEIDGYHSEEFKNPLVVMMKLMMLTKFILNIMKVVELVKTSWN